MQAALSFDANERETSSDDPTTTTDAGVVGASVSFVSAHQREQTIADAAAVLVVRAMLRVGERGQLAQVVMAAVLQSIARVGLELPPATERALQRMAFEPRPEAWHGLAEVVAESTASRMLVVLENLSCLANEAWRLDGEDSLFLLALLHSGLPVLLDDRDRSLRILGPARALESLCFTESVPAPVETLLQSAKALPSLALMSPLPRIETPVYEEPVAEIEAAPIEAQPQALDDEPQRPSRLRLRAAMAGVLAEPEPEPDDFVGWRTHALSLESARGPQSLASLEHLFLHDYLPLGEHLLAGLAEPRARRVFEEFRHNFARVYSEASQAFALRSKRPKMVLDAWAQAQKHAKSHNARPVMLLVDGLRYDVGQRLSRRLATHFELVGEEMLCSALPATTARQLETLARGPEALGLEHEPPSLEDVMRERTADNVRRVRTGSRDLFKLDVVEVRLRAHALTSDVDSAAEQAERAIVRFVADLEPERRHMLYVFGDHGFPFGKSSVEQLGAFPEQVLVPAMALLVPERT